MSGVDVEVFLAGGYAVFLVAAASGLLMGRASHGRAHRYRTAGFRFHPGLDAWECPEGEHLRRVDIDHERRIVWYRGRAHVCNACPAKDGCTDSSLGREIAQPMDPWPHSDVGHFHRGLSVVLVALAGLILCVEALRNHAPMDLLALALPAAITAIAGPRLIADFLTTPSRFPEAGRSGA